MVRHNKKNAVSISDFERLSEEFISATLELSEQCLLSGKVKGSAEASIAHTAMSAMYSIKAFLILAKESENNK